MKANIQFNKILIAVDASTYSLKAAEYGITLAKNLNAQVALIHVDEYQTVANISVDPIMGDQMLLLPDLEEIKKESAQKLLKQIIADFADGLNVIQILKTGDIKKEILETAKTWDAKIIVMGTHGRKGFDHFLLGSMAESITRNAHCPVFIVPNKEDDDED
ncbi:MAG: universal stress protein [Sphingobacteriales bacterium]|nr:MAG: universal stress protein [Sphingobacteriales bacterium]